MTAEANVKENTNSVGNGWSKGSFQETAHNGRLQKEKSSQKKKPPKDDLDDKPVDLSCGIWKFRTNKLGTKFSNLYVFTICVGISMLFTQMVHSVIHVQLTSIERQFNINNAKAGLFDTASKAGHLSTILIAGHFAKKVHIPVVVGLAGIFQGIILMIPAFMQLANPYTLPLLTGDNSSKSDNEKYFCYPNASSASNMNVHSGGSGRGKGGDEPSAAANEMAFVVICVVQAVKGVSDAFHSGFLPTLYVDNNMLDKTRMGIFFGIKYVIGELASPVGKQLNAILTEIPIDLKKTEMDTKDRRFVAAWWLAFLIFGAATAFFSIPILLFPRHLVSKKQQQAALQRAMVSFKPMDEKEKTITDKVKANDVVRDEKLDEDQQKRYWMA